MLSFLKRVFSSPPRDIISPEEASLPVAAMPAVAVPPVPQIPVVQPAPALVPAIETIALPLSDIAAKFPTNIRALTPASVAGVFLLPVSTAQAQLPSGAVRIPFGKIRQSCPPGTFADDASQDEVLVDLPLAKILSEINPVLLTRRNSQTKVAVPSAVEGVFNAKIPTFAAPVPAAAAPVPIEAPKPVAVMPTPVPAAALAIKLATFCKDWPESIKEEIVQAGQVDSILALPMTNLEKALKSGRVIFTWSQLRQWVGPDGQPGSSVNGETLLELPLKIIAPLFLAHRQGRAPVAVAVEANQSPNVFVADELKPVEKTITPEPIPIPVPILPAPAPIVQPASKLGALFGQPTKKEWSPEEITQTISAMPGVSSSLIAMSDGLHVAGELPPPMKSETLAAFLPQIFGRLNKYTDEVKLGGPLAAVTLMTGSAPCTIFKTGAVYLAVLGKAGQVMPETLLQQVAGELATQAI